MSKFSYLGRQKLEEALEKLHEGMSSAEYVLRLLPTGTHDWNKFITPQELQHMLDSTKYSFRTRLLHGMFYFPFFFLPFPFFLGSFT